MRRAFTLVELLVAISVLVLLMSLLLPALHAAREHSRNAGCVSNLRQIGEAVGSYMADHRAAAYPQSYDEMDIAPPTCPSAPQAGAYPLVEPQDPRRPQLGGVAFLDTMASWIIGSDPWSIPNGGGVWRHGSRRGETISPNPGSAQWLRTWRNKVWMDAHAGPMYGPLSPLPAMPWK